MLSQFDNKSQNHIRRSKSTTSVKERRKHPIVSAPQDPESARVHAVIAAHRAMDRSRTSTSGDLHRSDSSTSKQSTIPLHLQHAEPATPAAQLRRQRSILQSTTPHLVHSLPRPGGEPMAREQAPSFTQTTMSDFGGSFEGERSSYRRLRKARSVLNPNRGWHQPQTTSSSPLSQGKTLRHKTSTAALGTLSFKVRLKKSFDALRLVPRRATSPEKSFSEAAYCPESVVLARSQFLQAQQSPEAVQRSAITVKRSRKDFRSSLRSSQSGEEKDPQENKSSALNVARSISSSLRSRFKQAFSRPASGLPPQQMDASRAYFGDDVFGEHGNGGFDNYHSDNLAEQRRVSLYNSPWHEIVDEEDFQNLRTIIPVNVSDSSLAGSSKSRVTSWTNTTISEPSHETLVERKRLSVIQEDGDPHQPSCSAGTHLGGVPVLRKPLPSQLGRGADPQRLYSALVRRMNQESADRAREPLDNLQEHEEDSYIAETKANFPFVPATGVSLIDGQLKRQHASSSLNTSDTKQQRNYMSHHAHQANFATSEESVYSRTTNGGTDPHSRGIVRGVESDVPYNDHPPLVADVHTHRWLDKSNPFFASDVWGNARPSAETLSVPEEEAKVSQHHPLHGVDVVSSVEECHEATLSRVFTPLTDVNVNFKDDGRETVPIKAASHVREQAQIQADHSNTWSRQRAGESTTRRKNQAHGTARDAESTGTRTPSPSLRMPDQLSVAKRRFPLLNVKQVSKKGIPMASQSSSLTRSQSGLLQELTDPDRNRVQDESEFGRQKTLSSSLRKMSPNNVAKLLKEKKSMATLNIKSSNKENRSDTAATEVVVPEEIEAVSTPGPAYLAMRSGNSSGNKIEKGQTKKDDSPTGLVKATLSARLSRPFNMDTPEDNRPFDSMYLGKRELGFSDISGGRLSVATKQNIYGYNKQRSFDRGPGGYGGLGPPPFGTPGKSEEDTALPHIPTPENNRAKLVTKNGLSLGSKRMVSNFLRSRRKGNSSENDTPSTAHQEYATVKASEEATTSSPLFV